MKLNLRSGDVRVCRKLQKKYGKSYYFATKLFPKDMRDATNVLYAFFRLPDEIVDNPVLATPDAIENQLLLWKELWTAAYEGTMGWEKKVPDDFWIPVLRATSEVFHVYEIPFEYSEDFIKAMLQDVKKSTYASYAELERYMYGSAAVVGLMMTHVIGFTDKRALLYAEELGYAMQLTNFLRDIREDWEGRGRIYLPGDELKSFGITPEDLSGHNVSEMFKRFMGFQMSRARALYVSADEGVALLNKDGQFAVKVASTLYEAILDKIEEAQYDVFEKRVRTNMMEKLVLAYGVWKAEKRSSL
jgi:phytoene synthase